MLFRALLLAILSTASVAHADFPVTREDQVTCSKKGASGRLAACQKIAKAGDVAAYSNLIDIYQQGDGVAKDPAAASQWMLKLANAGNMTAMTSVGINYFMGAGLPKDLNQSLIWSRKGAEAGNPGGQWFLGLHLLTGDGFQKNVTEGLSWLTKSAELGFEASRLPLINWAMEHQTPGNLKMIARWAPQMKDSTNGPELAALGQIYYHGIGVPRDRALAQTLLNRGVSKGDSASQMLYANLYLVFPESGERDLAGARALLEKSWAQDNPLAGLRLAELDIFENKWKQDPTALRNLLEKVWSKIEESCDIEPSCYYESGKLVAIVREAGIGGPVDLAGAKDVYTKQSKRGSEGTESTLSEGNPWKPRGTRRFWQKSLLTDGSGPFTSEQQRDLGISLLRDIPSTVSMQGAIRPVLEFDVQIFVDSTLPVPDADVFEHVDAAAAYMKTCDVRLRKARVWRVKPGASVDKIREVSQPIINVFFSGTNEKDRLIGGWAQRADKTIQMLWTLSGSHVGGPLRRGPGSPILAHELAHVFELGHPNKLNSSPMQYGWLGTLGGKFTEEECELIRKHELLSAPGGMATPQVASTAAGMTATEKPSAAKSTPQNSAMNARYEGAFNDIRTLISKSNTSPFSRFSLNALSIKHDIPWSDTVNLMQAATSWRDEKQFSAARDFKAGQPADVENLDKVFDRRGNLLNALEHSLGKFRKQVLESNGLKLESFNETSRIKLRAGETFAVSGGDVSVISEDENYNLYLVGGDLFVVEPKSKIIFYVRKNVANFVKNENVASIWKARESGVFQESPMMTLTRVTNGAKPTSELTQSSGGYTPQTIPGGKVASPEEVAKLYQDATAEGASKPIVLSALNTAIRLPLANNAGTLAVPGSYDDDVQKSLAKRFEKISKDRVIITYCHHGGCWMSYYLSLRLIALGYTNVHWMRQGIDGWIAHDYPLVIVN